MPNYSRFQSPLLIALCLACLCAACAHGDVIHVKTTGDDANSGLSWELAKKTVQAGIDAASSGDEVWVAAGTYVETVALEIGVALYGGLTGEEASLNERDPDRNATVLDGNGERRYAVVEFPYGADPATRLDGFVVCNGREGGVRIRYGTPVICRNTITGNRTTYDGGGIRSSGGSPLVVGNTISGNVAGRSGGGVYSFGSSGQPVYANNIITGNAAEHGGGMRIWASHETRVVNNTIVANWADRGGGIYNRSEFTHIENCIIAYNNSGLQIGDQPLSIQHNCVYGNDDGNYVGMSDPTGSDGNISCDPQLAEVSFGNLHIQPDSPCRDAGDTSAVLAGWPDIDGEARVFGAAVDIGADESDLTEWSEGPYVVVRVRPDGDDQNDGSSWEFAKQTVQAGISAAQWAGGEVWVQEGTYGERLLIPPYVHVYGGFQGGELARDERDWLANLTVLDGEREDTVVTFHGGHQQSTLDGFLITRGDGNHGGGVKTYGSSPSIRNNQIADNEASRGGGLYCWLGAPSIEQNTIRGNSVTWRGGALYCSSGSPLIAANCITDNDGAIWDVGSSNIVRNRIVGNAGAAIACEGQGTTVDSNIIAANESWDGAAVRCEAGESRIVNNTIVHNLASSSTIYVTATSEQKISNNIVAFNTSGVYCSSTSSPILTANCVFGNEGPNYTGIPDPTGTQGNISVDPRFASLDLGNLHLQPDSPCVDAGDDSMADVECPDIDGQARVQGDHVDIGADESDGTWWDITPSIVRVSTDGDDANSGLTWPDAKRTVQAAIDAALQLGGEVWVEAGEYDERVALLPYVSLYGGFSGVEEHRDARDWNINASVLDGEHNGDVIRVCAGNRPLTISGLTVANGSNGVSGFCGSMDFSDNIVTANSKNGIVWPGDTGVLQRNVVCDNGSRGISCTTCTLTITDNTVRDNGGGGILCRSGSFLLSDNRIENNAAVFGGGLWWDESSGVVTGNTISRNTASSDGGGVYCDAPTEEGAAVDLTANLLTGNAASRGGGLYVIGSPGRIVNNLIAENTATSSGGGVYLRGSPDLFAHNTVAGNAGNGGIYVYLTSPTIVNSLIAFNSSGIYASGSSKPEMSHACVFGNASADYVGFPDPTGTDGNISVNPLLLDKENGDYHLLPGSPCIDAGAADGAPDTDLDGNYRPKDGDGDGTALFDIGCYEAPNNYVTIAGAKAVEDGSLVGITSCVSTAAFWDRFYVENVDRACGIGVLANVESVGKYVTVEGMMTTLDGERLIEPILTQEHYECPVPGPWFMTLNSLGGGPCGLQEGVTDWRTAYGGGGKSMFSHGGANNIGLLVKVTGRVDKIGDGFFYIDGESEFRDGRGRFKGVRVDWPFAEPAPRKHDFVEVVGVSSCTVRDGHVVRLLRPVSAESIRTLMPK